MTQYIEDAVTGKDTDAQTYVETLFNSKGVNNFDFMFYIADIFTLGVQYGSRIELCALLTSMKDSDLDKELDMKLQLPVLKQYADKKSVSISQYDRNALKAGTKVNFNDNMRQWTWQYCTEFAWFQTPFADHPMRSKLVALDQWVPYCQAIFGAEIGNPKVAETNTKYGGLDTDAKNVIFVNAIEDPW